MGRLHRIARLPAADQRALAGAACRLVGARLALALLPYPTVRRLYARPQRRLPKGVDAAAYRQRGVWAVKAAGRRVLGDRPCLAQALVAERLLRRGGAEPRLVIGVAKSDGALLAHAWVECDGDVVLGRRASPARFVPLRSVLRQASGPPEGPSGEPAAGGERPARFARAPEAQPENPSGSGVDTAHLLMMG